MPRRTLEPSERRQTISFTAQGKEVKMLDDFIMREQQKAPHAIVSRQTVLERLLLDFLEKIGRS